VIASTSEDTAGYYIFKDEIPESSTATSSNMIKYAAAADAGAVNLCGASDTLEYGQSYTFRAVAVDGSGTIGTGNASDAVEFDYTVTHKGAYLLSNTEGVDSAATTLGNLYDDTCSDTGAVTANKGISVKSTSEDETVKLSVEPKDNVSFSTDTPRTVYVGLNSGALAEIKYVPAYDGSKFYIEFDSVVYYGTLPTDSTSNNNSGNAMDVSSNTADTADQTL
jgi:hypothetical protein